MTSLKKNIIPSQPEMTKYNFYKRSLYPIESDIQIKKIDLVRLNDPVKPLLSVRLKNYFFAIKKKKHEISPESLWWKNSF